MLDRAINLPVAGNIHAQFAQFVSLAGLIVAPCLFVGIHERFDDLGNVALIDRAGVMQARDDRADRQLGSVVHTSLRAGFDNRTVAEAGRAANLPGGGVPA